MALEWLDVFPYFEMFTCIFALCSSFHFFYIIVNATILQATSRPFLLLFSVSLFLLAMSHGLKTSEVIIGLRPEDPSTGGFSIRHYVWSLLHEFAFALHSLSLFMFAGERYITAKFSMLPTSRNKIFAILLAGLISILAMAYAQLIHMVNFNVKAMTCMNIVDCGALLILVLSSKFSIKHYRNTCGVASLETRFQISDVYIWTQTIIPIASLAFLVKFIYVIVIWLLSSFAGGIQFQIEFSNYYETAMDLFTISLPFLIKENHRRLKNLKLRNRHVKPKVLQMHVKTLDGRAIHMKDTIHDHFDFLKNHWK